MSAKNLIDLTPGQTFGRWTVLGKAPTISRNARWLCRCSCGTERIVDSPRLRSGKSQSCGCAPRSRKREVLPPIDDDFVAPCADDWDDDREFINGLLR